MLINLMSKATISYKNNVSIAVLAIFLLLSGCAGYSATGGPGKLVKSPLSFDVSDGFKPLRVNQVGILPVETLSLNTKFDNQTEESLTSELVQAFQVNSSLEIRRLEAPSKNATLKERAAKAGQSANVQGVLVGLVADSQPLSIKSEEYKPVRFEIRLFDQKTGEVVWTAFFVSENEPLTDNLFTIGQKAKRKFKYQSKAEAIKYGFTTAALELEKLRSTSASARQ